MFCGPVKLILYFVITLCLLLLVIYEWHSMYFVNLFMHIWFVSNKKELSVFIPVLPRLPNETWLAVVGLHDVVYSCKIILYSISDQIWSWVNVTFWNMKFETSDCTLCNLISDPSVEAPSQTLEETHCYLWETFEILNRYHLCISFPRVHTSSTTWGRCCDGNGPCVQPIRCPPAPRPCFPSLLSITSALGLLMSRLRSHRVSGSEEDGGRRSCLVSERWSDCRSVGAVQSVEVCVARAISLSLKLETQSLSVSGDWHQIRGTGRPWLSMQMTLLPSSLFLQESFESITLHLALVLCSKYILKSMMHIA